MSTKSTQVCDRCGKEIKYAEFPYSRVSKITYISIFGFSPFAYNDTKIELCKKCTEEHDRFMREEA